MSGEENSQMSDESSLEEEAEPKLKYNQFSVEVLKEIRDSGDSISATAVHSKFMVIGTEMGREFLLDAEGNLLRKLENKKKVLSLSRDSMGEFLASISGERVTLGPAISGVEGGNGVDEKENTLKVEVNEDFSRVAIDPIYYKSGSGRRFMVAGSSKVLLYEKSMFNRYKQSVLSSINEGPIYEIRWGGRFAAWCSRKGVRVFNVVTGETVSLIKPPLGYDRFEIPTRILWVTQTLLLVCQGDALRVCTIRKRFEGSNSSLASTASSVASSTITVVLPQHLVEIIHTFVFEDLWLMGAATLDNSLYVVLGIRKDGKDKRPVFVTVEHSSFSEYSVISSDILGFKDCNNFKPRDYHMEFLTEDFQYLLVSPKDVIVARLRDQDDHMDFLIENLRYPEALEHAEENEKLLKRHKVSTVGRAFLDHLILSERYKEAGALCARVLGRDRELWRSEVIKFSKMNQLKAVAPILPIDDAYLRLDSDIYEMILFEFLNSDHEGFLQIIRRWSPELYNVSTVVNHVVEKLLTQRENETLLRALATLFTFQKKYDKALAMYLKLGHLDVFNLIRAHGLVSSVTDKIENLLELDHKEAIAFFLENIEALPPELIVEKIGYNKYLLEYLDTIKDSPISWPFHWKLVELYADFESHKLLNFLKNSDHYPIQQALDVCEARCLTHERIYILARMCNTRKALELITTELSDIYEAVDFCKKYDDPELWKDLIDFSLDKPYFINVLLHNIGTHVDPRILIMKIEKGKQIPGLRDSLVQIMMDYRLQIPLQEGCKRILVSDCYSLLNRKYKTKNRGISVRSDSYCGVCNLKMIQESTPSNDIIVFMCHHAYHLDCMSDSTVCLICHSSYKNKRRTF